MFHRLKVAALFSLNVGAALLLLAAQAPPKDISAVFADGKINGREYENGYFGVKITTKTGEIKQGFVSPQGNRARLVDVYADSQNWDEKYTLAVLADLRSENPRVQSAAHYVGIVRRQFEKEGWETVQEDSPIEISGKKFVEGVVKRRAEGRYYYRGMYTTFVKGYILSLDVTAASPGRLREVVKMVHFNSSAN